MPVTAKFAVVCSILFLLNLSASNAQMRVNSCGIDQTIPAFTADTVVPIDAQLPVKLKFVSLLKASRAKWEIRMYTYYLADENGYLKVISCDGDTVIARFYIWSPSPSNKRLSHADSLAGDRLALPVRWRVKPLKLSAETSWNQLFKGLIDSHFFTLPNQQTISGSLTDAQKQEEEMAHGYTVFEVKVDGHYRSMRYNKYYSGSDAPEPYKYLTWIFSAFQKLTPVF
jgi:hypothetical protein